MSDPVYREIIMDHYKKPRNYGVMEGKFFEAANYNSHCGDKVRVMVRLQKGKIIKLKFTGKGCAVSLAMTSMMTEEMVGVEVEKFKKMTGEKYLKKMEMSFSPARVHCALLGFSALKKALSDQ